MLIIALETGQILKLFSTIKKSVEIGAACGKEVACCKGLGKIEEPNKVDVTSRNKDDGKVAIAVGDGPGKREVRGRQKITVFMKMKSSFLRK